MELSELIRRAGSVALVVPRQLGEIVNAGSIENVRDEIRIAGFRRKITHVLEEAEKQPDGSGIRKSG